MIDRKKADKYNREHAHELTAENLTELAIIVQLVLNLEVDGAIGPRTRKALDNQRTAVQAANFPTLPVLSVDSAGSWLVGPNVTRMEAHPSWYTSNRRRGRPRGVIWHYTATRPGTGVTMAKRRTRRFGEDSADRKASWHVTIDTDGSIIQSVPFDFAAWHAGGKYSKPIPSVGSPNWNTIGIELVSMHGEDFPGIQVEAAARVARAIVKKFLIRESLQLGHVDVHEWKQDPGPEWLEEHRPRVMRYAYAKTV